MKNKQTKINYTDIWGLREEKYKYLEENDIFSTKWRSIKPQEPHNFFTIKDFKGIELYNQFIPLDKIFRQFNAGLATGKDDFLVDYDKKALLNRLSLNDKLAFDLLIQQQGVDKELAEKWYAELQKIDIETQIRPVAYRPFDTRWIIYNTRLLQRARDVIMSHLLRPNLALLTMRQYVYSFPYSHAFVTEDVVDRRIFISNRGAAHVFPLYIYTGSSQQELFNQTSKSSNLQWGNLGWLKTLQSFTSKLSGNFIQPAEAIFYYIYAILYSNTYREKYQEFLKIDFPRVPFTKDYGLFKRLVELGEQLVQLHLLKHPEFTGMTSQYNGSGTDKIEKYDYQDTEKRVYINDSQYFGSITPEVWEYRIGGYQVLEKWLKDRKGRTLSAEDIKHYCRMVTALAETIETQRQIDRSYPKVEETLSR